MMPNYYCYGAMQSPCALPLTSQKEIKAFSTSGVLNALSQALNTSLRNYEQQYTKTV
jgi:hypothetical protein